jgi:hypothetical protein
MLDEIKTYHPLGGPRGLGHICGIKRVDPDEWFFEAHFYQDPVCPGSLGIESFLQLLRFIALERWPDLAATHGVEPVAGLAHNWSYRGQVTQKNRQIEVIAVVTDVVEGDRPSITADGLLRVDGLDIYRMEAYGLRLVPHENG